MATVVKVAGIGLFGDSIEALEAALDYLRSA